MNETHYHYLHQPVGLRALTAHWLQYISRCYMWGHASLGMHGDTCPLPQQCQPGEEDQQGNDICLQM